MIAIELKRSAHGAGARPVGTGKEVDYLTLIPESVRVCADALSDAGHDHLWPAKKIRRL